MHSFECFHVHPIVFSSPIMAMVALAVMLISLATSSGQYVIIDEEKSWSDANDYCAAKYGTRLATIRNDYDAEDLLHNVEHSGSDSPLWVGLHDPQSTGVYGVRDFHG